MKEDSGKVNPYLISFPLGEEMSGCASCYFVISHCFNDFVSYPYFCIRTPAIEKQELCKVPCFLLLFTYKG